jgi:DNA-binding NtrC family response regulator
MDARSGPGRPGGPEGFLGRTVLLVDDDTSVLEMVGETMTAMGHTVITASDGCEALRLLLENRSINCLFTDVVMPNDMSGVQLMAAARAVRPGLPTLLASSYPREVVYGMGAIPSDIHFITKPYLLSDLNEQLCWSGGAAAQFHPSPVRARAADQARHPHYLRLAAASKKVRLGESWIWEGGD